MKHWHQCVKYTLPQCSFQFIFLLVSYVYKKGAAKKKEVTEGDQSLAGDRGWHFVILSQAWESPPLVPCINTSFVSCHHRRHCANDVTTRPEECVLLLRALWQLPGPVAASLIRFPEAGSFQREAGRGPAIRNSHALVRTRDFSVLVLTASVLCGGPIKANFLFPK